MNFTLSQRPLFIIGSPRSGTSLLRLIMTSHSQVLIPPECGFIIWLHNKYGNWNVADNIESIKLHAFIDDLLKCKKMDTWKINKAELKEQILINQPMNYAELCAIIYLTYSNSINNEFLIWGDKNNYYLNHLNLLLELYENASFLHIVRDGRDVACSYREVMSEKSDSPYAPRLATNIYDIAVEWSSNVVKINSFMTQAPVKKTMTIKYEELVSNPSYTIMSVCAWLDIPFEPNMINFYRENKNMKLEPEMTLDWKKRTLEPISNETVGRYFRTLSADEQHEFCKLADGALRRFSYI